MKNILKGMVAGHFLRKMKHRRRLHALGGAALALGRPKIMLVLGAFALGTEYLRKRKERKQQIPTTTEFDNRPID